MPLGSVSRGPWSHPLSSQERERHHRVTKAGPRPVPPQKPSRGWNTEQDGQDRATRTNKAPSSTPTSVSAGLGPRVASLLQPGPHQREPDKLSDLRHFPGAPPAIGGTRQAGVFSWESPCQEPCTWQKSRRRCWGSECKHVQVTCSHPRSAQGNGGVSGETGGVCRKQNENVHLLGHTGNVEKPPAPHPTRGRAAPSARPQE